MEIDEIDQRAMDAIATLTGLTPGDVYYKSIDGEFVNLAIEALVNFTEKWKLKELKEDTPPVDDIVIMEAALAASEEELKEVKDNKEKRALIASIESLRKRIQLERDLQRSS